MADDKAIRYFFQDGICGNGGETHKVRDWLNDFGINDLDDCADIWNKTTMLVAEVTCKIMDETRQKMLANALFHFMYLNFNMDEDYIPQAERNYEKIKEVLEMWEVFTSVYGT